MCRDIDAGRSLRFRCCDKRRMAIKRLYKYCWCWSMRSSEERLSEPHSPGSPSSAPPGLWTPFRHPPSTSGCLGTPPDTIGHFGHRRTSNVGHLGHHVLGHLDTTSDTPDMCLRTPSDTTSDTFGQLRTPRTLRTASGRVATFLHQYLCTI